MKFFKSVVPGLTFANRATMAASAQVTLRKKPNGQGLYPLAIRFTKNRCSTYKHIGIYIDIEDWDSKDKLVKDSHPDSKKLNELVKSKLKEARKGLTALRVKDNDTTAHYIKKEIYRPSKKLSFFELAQEHLDDLEASENYNRLSCDSGLLSYVRSYHKSKQLTFKEIDERFLKKLKIHLQRNHSVSETTIMNTFVLIRLLYNRAIKAKMVKKKHYPFGGDGIKIKFPETEKIGLNAEEILSLESVESLTDGEIHARNVWMYSFNLAGVRVSDVLRTRWSDIRDDRLLYRMSKNSKLLSLKISDKVKKILSYYEPDKRHPNDFIFPELKIADLNDKKDIHRVLKTGGKKLNDNLKSLATKAGIDKKLTMHIARHSFGNIAGDAIHPLMLQKLYRHSDLKTTINYQANFIHKAADEALNNVLDF